MKLLKNKNNYIVRIVIVASLLFTNASLLVAPTPVFAACDATTNQTGDGGCMQQAWKDAQKAGFSGDYSTFQKKVNECQGTDEVKSSNWTKYLGDGYSTDTQNGSCANAIRSCYQNASDANACADKDVLALIASCNNGDVGSGGTSNGGANKINPTGTGPSNAGCGTNNAIDTYNRLAQKETYQTNHGMMNKYSDGLKNAECSGDKYTSEDAIQECKNKIDKQLSECEYDTGSLIEDPDGNIAGTSGKRYALGKYDQTKVNNCMATKATSEADCMNRTDKKGKWDEATQKCTPAATTPNDKDGNGIPDDQEKADSPGDITKTTTKCGQARVNLLACGDEQGAGAFNNILKIVLQVLTVLVGVAAVGGLAYASITYARAEDNASLTGEAKTLIRNIVIGILLYGFLIAIVSWLVPGLSIL